MQKQMEKEVMYKHEPQNQAVMLLVNTRGVLLPISKFKKRILMKTCIPSLIRDQSWTQSLSYLPKKHFPTFQRIWTQKPFTCFVPLGKLQNANYLHFHLNNLLSQALRFICTYACNFQGTWLCFNTCAIKCVSVWKYKKVPKRLSQRKTLRSL